MTQLRKMLYSHETEAFDLDRRRNVPIILVSSSIVHMDVRLGGPKAGRPGRINYMRPKRINLAEWSLSYVCGILENS